MKTANIITIAAISALILAVTAIRTPLFANEEQEAHEYTIRVDGTKGVRLNMLLIAKPPGKGAPIRKTTAFTVPFETTVKATSFYVWFDTLSDGASGSDGDRIEGSCRIDGELQGGGFGSTLKNSNRQAFEFGNL